MAWPICRTLTEPLKVISWRVYPSACVGQLGQMEYWRVSGQDGTGSGKMIEADLRGCRARRSRGSRLLLVDGGCQSLSAMSDVHDSKTFNQEMYYKRKVDMPT
jgi:hypothetical protein